MVETLLNAAIVLLPLAYMGAWIAYGSVFFGGRAESGALASTVLKAAVVIHGLYLLGLAARWGQFPVATAPQAMSIVAFAVAVVYLFVEWHGNERSTGFWLVSLAFAFQVLASLLHRGDPPQQEMFSSPLFGLHISLALLGYASFAVAAAYGFLFLELYRELKDGRFRIFYGRLPALEVLETMTLGALWAGFVTLTGAVATGAFWAARLFPETWMKDPIFLFTSATWALYGTALTLRHLQRWQGRQTAIASLAGLAAILVSLLAVNFLFPGFHGFRG